MKNKAKKILVSVGTFFYSVFGIQKIVDASTRIQLYAMTRYGAPMDTKFDNSSTQSNLSGSASGLSSGINYKITLPIAILFFAIGLLTYSFGKGAENGKKKTFFIIQACAILLGIILGIVTVLLLMKK